MPTSLSEQIMGEIFTSHFHEIIETILCNKIKQAVPELGQTQQSWD